MQTTTTAYYTDPDADPGRHCLDLYRPGGGAELPVLVFVHGGVWQLGSKDEYHNVGEAFARRGILTAVINYRLSPEVKHPAHAQDVARAVAWIVQHASEFGARADRVFLAGHSAGGHLIALLLFDPTYLRAEGVDPESLAGVIPLSGIFNLTEPIDDTLEGGFERYIYPTFGGATGDLETASPARWLRPTRVPLLVILAGDDYRDMQRQSTAFVEALRGRDIPVTVEIVTGRDHGGLVHAIGLPGDPTTDLIADFVRRAS